MGLWKLLVIARFIGGPLQRYWYGRWTNDPPARCPRHGSQPAFAWPVNQRSDVPHTSLHQPTSLSDSSQSRSALSGSSAYGATPPKKLPRSSTTSASLQFSK